MTVIYSNGHIYNKANGKRLVINEGDEFEMSDKYAEYCEKDLPISSSKEIAQKAQRSNENHYLILNAGEKLYYKINTKNKKDIFIECEILEDLWGHFTKKDGCNLYDCVCKNIKCINDDIFIF